MSKVFAKLTGTEAFTCVDRELPDNPEIDAAINFASNAPLGELIALNHDRIAQKDYKRLPIVLVDGEVTYLCGFSDELKKGGDA